MGQSQLSEMCNMRADPSRQFSARYITQGFGFRSHIFLFFLNWTELHLLLVPVLQGGGGGEGVGSG